MTTSCSGVASSRNFRNSWCGKSCKISWASGFRMPAFTTCGFAVSPPDVEAPEHCAALELLLIVGKHWRSPSAALTSSLLHSFADLLYGLSVEVIVWVYQS